MPGLFTAWYLILELGGSADWAFQGGGSGARCRPPGCGYPSPAGLADLRRAEDLGKTNYALIAATSFYSLLELRAQEPAATPDSLQQSVRKEILLLSNLGRQPDKKAAARALAALGWVQLAALQDAGAARASAREAVADDPALDSAWDVLIGTSLAEELTR